MKKEETILQDKIIKYLKEHKIYHIRYNAQSASNGIPDLIICYKGQFIGCELKTTKGKATDLQLKKIQSITDSMGWGILIASLEALIAVFICIDGEKRCPVCHTSVNYKE